jgi:excinuclease ABC subunit B
MSKKDKSSQKPEDLNAPSHDSGFGEAPQAEFSGIPLSSSVGDWSHMISEMAEQPEAMPSAPAAKKPAAKKTEKKSTVFQSQSRHAERTRRSWSQSGFRHGHHHGRCR